MRFRTPLLAAACALLVAVFVAVPASASNDPFWSQQWGMRKVGADKAWATGTGAGETIAIVDTGVDLSHPDLKAKIVPGYDFVDNDTNPTDEFGHGTHVAGIAAAVTNNGVGVAGVAPGAKIMPVRVLDSTGHGTNEAVDEGIRWAADHGAAVINLSLGDGVVVEDVSGGSMSSACDYAWSKGSICVVSAGNQQFFRTDYQDAHAIIVTATGPDDSKASYATGDGLAPWGLAAPGGTDTDGTASEIVSTYWSQAHGDGYAYAMGTSMAAPHVSGAAAILRGLGLTPQETVDRLLQTATNIGSSLTFGHGLLNIAAAVDGLRAKRASSGGASSGPVSETTPNAPAASSSVGSGRSASTATTTKRGTPTTTASSEPVTTTPAGLALFSPEPQRRTGKGIGWTVGAVVLCLGAAGAGIFTYRLRRGSS